MKPDLHVVCYSQNSNPPLTIYKSLQSSRRDPFDAIHLNGKRSMQSYPSDGIPMQSSRYNPVDAIDIIRSPADKIPSMESIQSP